MQTLSNILNKLISESDRNDTTLKQNLNLVIEALDLILTNPSEFTPRALSNVLYNLRLHDLCANRTVDNSYDKILKFRNSVLGPDIMDMLTIGGFSGQFTPARVSEIMMLADLDYFNTHDLGKMGVNFDDCARHGRFVLEIFPPEQQAYMAALFKAYAHRAIVVDERGVMPDFVQRGSLIWQRAEAYAQELQNRSPIYKKKERRIYVDRLENSAAKDFPIPRDAGDAYDEIEQPVVVAGHEVYEGATQTEIEVAMPLPSASTQDQLDREAAEFAANAQPIVFRLQRDLQKMELHKGKINSKVIKQAQDMCANAIEICDKDISQSWKDRVIYLWGQLAQLLKTIFEKQHSPQPQTKATLTSTLTSMPTQDQTLTRDQTPTQDQTPTVKFGLPPTIEETPMSNSHLIRSDAKVQRPTPTTKTEPKFRDMNASYFL